MEDVFAGRREEMVRTQLERRGISDPLVLAAMRTVPRERFVPDDIVDEAYADRAMPIGLAQTISQPYMVAAMTSALRLTAGSRVLEIGTGSGYHAAVLSRIAREVVTIERHAPLADAARERLLSLGYGNVTVVAGDGTLGWPPLAPYDGILVAAGAARIPDALRDQLAEGGHLVIPIGGPFYQELVVVTRQGEAFPEARGEACIFVPLIGPDGKPV